MKGDARNRRLRDLVRRLVQASTDREPSVVLIEDLQWVDPASAVFLDTLVEAVPGSGGLVVATFRPEYRASWMSGSHYRQIPLSTLPLLTRSGTSRQWTPWMTPPTISWAKTAAIRPCSAALPM